MIVASAAFRPAFRSRAISSKMSMALLLRLDSGCGWSQLRQTLHAGERAGGQFHRAQAEGLTAAEPLIPSRNSTGASPLRLSRAPLCEGHLTCPATTPEECW